MLGLVGYVTALKIHIILNNFCRSDGIGAATFISKYPNYINNVRYLKPAFKGGIHVFQPNT
jgi:hypothetical protein